MQDCLDVRLVIFRAARQCKGARRETLNGTFGRYGSCEKVLRYVDHEPVESGGIHATHEKNHRIHKPSDQHYPKHPPLAVENRVHAKGSED